MGKYLGKISLKGVDYLVVEEVPGSLVDTLKEEVGLDESTPVKAFYLEGLESPGVYRKERKENPYHLVVLPSGEKRYGRGYLKHELSHLAVSSVDYEGYKSPEGYAKEELRVALVLSKGTFRAIDIASMISTLVDQFGLTFGKARSVVRQEALKMGYPTYIIRRGIGMGEQYRIFMDLEGE